MAASESSEIIFEVPKELVLNCNGFSIDFGGSVVKVVYRQKDDWEEAHDQKNDSTTAKLRLRSYARPDYKDALEFVKQNCHVSRDVDNCPVIFTTGIGCYQYAETINNTLNVTTKILTEFDCFVKSFYYLAKHKTMAGLEYVPSEASLAKTKRIQEEMLKMLQLWKTHVKEGVTGMELHDVEDTTQTQLETESCLVSDKPLAEALPDFYPCMLAMIGSGVVYMMVNADGSFKVFDGSNRGGRMFLGLGSLLTGGPKTYEELMDLAVRGDNKKVDIFGSDLKNQQKKEKPKEEDGEKLDDFYSLLEVEDMMDNVTFCFGKGAENEAESFKKEDLVRTVLHTMIMDLVQTISLSMVVKGIKRCFISGSFINHELVRDLMMEEWTMRNSANAGLFGMPLDYECHFLKVGSHLGALGAILNNTEAIVATPNAK